jgi:hypothetical protein
LAPTGLQFGEQERESGETDCASDFKRSFRIYSVNGWGKIEGEETVRGRVTAMHFYTFITNRNGGFELCLAELRISLGENVVSPMGLCVGNAGTVRGG